MKLTCFNANDVRGRLGEQINEQVACRIAFAFTEVVNPQKVVIGSDVRLTSVPLKQVVIAALLESGVEVIDLGTTGTEEMYFATQYLKADGGIQITASHNAANFNGMKLVKADSEPLTSDDLLPKIQHCAENILAEKIEACLDKFSRKGYQEDSFLLGYSRLSQALLNKQNGLSFFSIQAAYIDKLMSLVDLRLQKPLRIVVNPGHGGAGGVLDAIERELAAIAPNVSFVKINHQPDGRFPKGAPNPMLKHNRVETSEAVVAENADLGIAWDGDFDRCFIFDETGRCIEAYYLVGLIAKCCIAKEQGAKILHDHRLYWNTEELVPARGAKVIGTKSGHGFIKKKMRCEKAVYAGEMSAHHYFRDFGYCDSGMLPWLHIVELLGKGNQSLSQLVDKRIKAFPISGEINISHPEPESAMDLVFDYFQPDAVSLNKIDGLDICFASWRFNLRQSNTENVLRLNVEARHDKALVEQKTNEILAILRH